MYWHEITWIVFIQHHRRPTNFLCAILAYADNAIGLQIFNRATDCAQEKLGWEQDMHVGILTTSLFPSSIFTLHKKKLWRLAQSAMESMFRHTRYILASSPGNEGAKLGTYMLYSHILILIVHLHMHMRAVMYWNYKLFSVLQHGLRCKSVCNYEIQGFYFYDDRRSQVGGMFLLMKEGRQDCSQLGNSCQLSKITEFAYLVHKP